MDVQFINPVLNSVKTILTSMANLPSLDIGKPQIKDKDAIACGVITGIMTMIGSKAKASIALTFSKPAILAIANRMLPEEHTELDGMITDLVGELANIILGDAKSQLEKLGLDFDLSLPIIIIGNDHLIAHKANAPIIMVPLTVPEGKICIEAVYEQL